MAAWVQARWYLAQRQAKQPPSRTRERFAAGARGNELELASLALKSAQMAAKGCRTRSTTFRPPAPEAKVPRVPWGKARVLVARTWGPAVPSAGSTPDSERSKSSDLKRKVVGLGRNKGPNQEASGGQLLRGAEREGIQTTRARMCTLLEPKEGRVWLTR